MSEIHTKITLPQKYHGWRLDQALHALFPEHSRSQWQTLIKSRHITVNGKFPDKQRDKIQSGQILEVHAPLEPATTWQAERLSLNIIDEDEALIIINKPAGLVVHPGAGRFNHTLANALLHHAPQMAKLPRSGIIHRIDKDTTGLLVVAKTPYAYQQLTQQLQHHEMTREYEAIIKGVLISGGTINAPIGRHPRQRTKMAIRPYGKPAITHYRIIERLRYHTYIKVHLETGRTHQIRVHFDHIFHPLLGDMTYGAHREPRMNTSSTGYSTIKQFPRQALHARRLTLRHPHSNEQKTWTSALPYDMQNLLVQLRKDAINSQYEELDKGGYSHHQ